MLFSFFPKSKQKKKENISNMKNNECIDLIKESLKQEENDYCVECGDKDPQYISINNSIFLCKECILNHLQLSQEVSTIIKNDLKILTLNEIQYICNGGNLKLLDFVSNEYPELNKFEPHIFYNTKAMDYYRKRLKYLSEGGEEPIKPSLNDGYTIIQNNKENDMTDMDIDDSYEEKNRARKDLIIDKKQKHKDKNDNSNYKDIYENKINNNKNIINDIINKIDNNINKNNTTLHRKNYTDSKNIKNNNESAINDNKNVKTFIKSNLENYKENIRYNKITKTIKFKKNFNNFDNEKYNENYDSNYNYNTNKTCNTIEITNSNFKSLKYKGSNDFLKNGILSPEPTSSNYKNTTPDTNTLIKNIYSKPKGISYFNKYRFRTKTDTSKLNGKDEINIVFNVNEFSIDNKKNNIKENKKKDEENNEKKYYEKIQNAKIKTSRIKNEDITPKRNINKTYVVPLKKREMGRNMAKNNILNSHIEERKVNNNINDEIKYNKKDKNKNIANNNNISVNIAHLKIIKNINNYNINIEPLEYKNKNDEKKEKIIYKTNLNSYKKKDNEKIYSLLPNKEINQKNELNSSKKLINFENEKRKSETAREIKKILSKTITDYKTNKTYKENEPKNRPKEPFRNYQTFIMNRSSLNKEIDFKYNEKLFKRNNDNSDEKNFSFNNIREKYRNREKKSQNKNIIKKEYERNKERQKLNEKIINKSMEEPYKGFFKESIRNKYKRKKFN